jgi:hypothetical protein
LAWTELDGDAKTEDGRSPFALDVTGDGFASGLMASGNWFRLIIYSALFLVSLSLLQYGGSAPDYAMWQLLRDVVWQTACEYAMAVGSSPPPLVIPSPPPPPAPAPSEGHATDRLSSFATAELRAISLGVFFMAWFTFLMFYSWQFVARSAGRTAYFFSYEDDSDTISVDEPVDIETSLMGLSTRGYQQLGALGEHVPGSPLTELVDLIQPVPEGSSYPSTDLHRPPGQDPSPILDVRQAPIDSRQKVE